MKKLDDIEIAELYIGKQYSTEKLLEVAYPNRENEYLACNADFSKEQMDLFGITPLLHEKWGYYGVDFTVFIHVDNDTIKDCYIYKARESFRCGRSRTTCLEPTQQEIRIFRRIMDYVTACV